MLVSPKETSPGWQGWGRDAMRDESRAYQTLLHHRPAQGRPGGRRWWKEAERDTRASRPLHERPVGAHELDEGVCNYGSGEKAHAAYSCSACDKSRTSLTQRREAAATDARASGACAAEICGAFGCGIYRFSSVHSKLLITHGS